MGVCEKRKLNIWFISAYDAPEGNSSRTYDYATELTDLGHNVTLFTSSYCHFTHRERLDKNEKWREEYFGKVRVFWLKTIPYNGNGLKRAANMISNAYRAFWVGSTRNERPDVIFGPSVPLFTGIAALLLAKIKRCPFIFEVRDIWPQALIDLGALSERNPIAIIFKMMEIVLYKQAKKIIAVLPYAYKHICNYGILKENIIWIPNGVKLSRYAEINPYSGGTRMTLTVMYLGGFSLTHDIDTIIEAARILKDEKGFKFIIIGGGKGKDKCEETVRLHSLNNIIFKDPVNKVEIPHVLEEADVLIASVRNTPVYQFGINSNKIFDYLGSGRPIIFAGNTPNDPVTDACAGITIPPEDPIAMSDALKKMMHMSPLERKQLGNNGLEYARQHFDTHILAKHLENVIMHSLGEQV
jgi:glycosyltransferase involved in cell wall biosynthesis